MNTRWSVWESEDGRTRCYTSFSKAVAEEEMEVLKKWGYLGRQRLPEEVKKEVVKKVKNFPQFIIVNMKGKRTQVFIRWKKVSF